jgi:hypothetical protein
MDAMGTKEAVERVRKLYDEHKELKAVATEKYHELEAAELHLQQLLEEAETVEYEKIKKEFKVQLKIDKRARVPKSDEDRAAFFGWLKEKGYYDQYVTVNSQSINALVKQEAALSEDEEFSVPGLEIIEEVKLKY